MSFSMSRGLTQMAAIIGLGCFLGGSSGAIVQSAATEAVAQVPAPTSVNRTHKTDRLVGVGALRPDRKNATGFAPSTRKRPPLGCDPAFSPIAAPDLGHIFKRCMV